MDRLTTTTNSIVGSSSNSGGDSNSSSSGSSDVFKEPFRNQFPDGFLITTGKIEIVIIVNIIDNISYDVIVDSLCATHLSIYLYNIYIYIKSIYLPIYLSIYVTPIYLTF